MLKIEQEVNKYLHKVFTDDFKITVQISHPQPLYTHNFSVNQVCYPLIGSSIQCDRAWILCFHFLFLYYNFHVPPQRPTSWEDMKIQVADVADHYNWSTD
jgi:hypothetical protein